MPILFKLIYRLETIPNKTAAFDFGTMHMWILKCVSKWNESQNGQDYLEEIKHN